jgi:hypothetical protein
VLASFEAGIVEEMTMILNYQDRTMKFSHEQEMWVVLRFMFGNDVALSPLRQNDQEAYRKVLPVGKRSEATLYFLPGEEW